MEEPLQLDIDMVLDLRRPLIHHPPLLVIPLDEIPTQVSYDKSMVCRSVHLAKHKVLKYLRIVRNDGMQFKNMQQSV